MVDSDENSEGNKNLNKDKLTRQKKEKFMGEVGELIKLISDDPNYGSRSWDKRIESVKKAGKVLNSPHFVLKQLTSIKEKMTLSHDVRKVESALRELQSVFQQSKNIVLNEVSAKETHEFSVDHILLDGNEDLRMKVKAMGKAKEESQSFGEELKEILAILDKTHQSAEETMVYVRVTKLLQRVVNSCLNIATGYILSEDCGHQVEGQYVVEKDDEKLTVKFPQTPDSIQINKKGKNVEFHNQEMVDQEKQGNQVILTLKLEGERLAELNLAKMGSLEVGSASKFWSGFGEEDQEFPLPDWSDPDGFFISVTGEVTSNAAANPNVLDEIFREHPDICDNLQITSEGLMEYFKKELVQIYQKIIKGNPEMLKLEDIRNMQAIVRDMELNGLQVTWVQEKLAKCREKLEAQEARNEVRKRFNSGGAETEETEQELAHSAKKPRFQ